MNTCTSLQVWSVLRVIVLYILGAVIITGCSEQMAGAGSGGTGSNRISMGGAIQGKALSLTNAVTTIAGNTSTSGGTASSADGTGAGARFSNPNGITSDGTNLYVADFANCTIRKIDTATGTVTTLAGIAGVPSSNDGFGTEAGFSYPSGITTDGTNLYVTESGSGKVRKVALATREVTTLAGPSAFNPNDPPSVDGIGSDARFFFPAGVTTDGTNLYVADSGNQSIRKIVISTGSVSTLAGTAGVRGSGDGTGAGARFDYPQGITLEGTNLYVADYYNGSIRKIEIATGVVTTLATGLFTPSGITSDGAYLYVGENQGNRISKVNISTGEIATVAGSTIRGTVDGYGTTARFDYPQGIVVDGPNLYVADSGNNSIRKIIIASGAVSTLAGVIAADGIGSAASFFVPISITTNGTNLYVIDYAQSTIRKIVPSTGVVTTLTGSPSSGLPIDGTGTAATFGHPQGITTDGTYLYVLDGQGSTIRQIEISTGVVTTLAGSAFEFGASNGIGTAARFHSATSITTDGKNLYVTDATNRTIRNMEISTGAVTTLAGTPGIIGSADGTGAAASFSDLLQGITTDGTNLYVADSRTIRKIVISTGVVTTLAGDANFDSPIDGIGAAANFYRVAGITTDGANLYVTDLGAIRKIVISTGEVTTIAGKAWTVGATDGTGAAASFQYPYGITTDGTSLYVADTGNNLIRKIR